MILRSILPLLISSLLLWPNAAWSKGYDMSRFGELANLRWGMSLSEIKKSTKFLLQERVSESQYIETGEFDAKPCQYSFSFFDNGLKSVVIMMKLSKEDILKVKKRFIRLYGKPTIYDPGKNAYQWKDNQQEATIAILSNPTTSMLIGFRQIMTASSGLRYGPDKLSSLQGVFLGMSLVDLQKMPHFKPLVKVSEEIYETHTFFNSRPSTATFVFRNGLLKVIGLNFTIEDASKNEINRLFSDSKDFLISKYGPPTYENRDIPSLIWKEGNFNTMFRWLKDDRSSVLYFNEE